MMLYLVRHGRAVDVGEAGIACDDDRVLTEEGRKRTEETARGLWAAGCEPRRIVSSPLARARETAEILAEVLGGGVAVELVDLLTPAADPTRLAAWLGKQKEESILLVGHLPSIAELASLLVFGAVGPNLDFKKSGACAISFEGKAAAGGGRLEWFAPPALLRRLAAARG